MSLYDLSIPILIINKQVFYQKSSMQGKSLESNYRDA